MVWGWLVIEIAGDFIQIKSITRNENYHSILQWYAILFDCCNIGQKFVLQQDNDPKHSSKLYTNDLKSKESKRILQIMVWPIQSLDLTPIELVRDEIDWKVRSELPKNKQELFTHWLEITSTNIFLQVTEKRQRIFSAEVDFDLNYCITKCNQRKKKFVEDLIHFLSLKEKLMKSQFFYSSHTHTHIYIRLIIYLQ